MQIGTQHAWVRRVAIVPEQFLGGLDGFSVIERIAGDHGCEWRFMGWYDARAEAEQRATALRAVIMEDGE